MDNNTIKPVGSAVDRFRVFIEQTRKESYTGLSPEEREKLEARDRRMAREIHESDSMGGG